MAQPTPLQDRFTGIWQDTARDQLPAGKVWDMADYIPGQLGAPLRKRGGYGTTGSALTTLNASAGEPWRVLPAPFSSTQILAIDQDLFRLFDITNSADRGVAQLPLGPMVFYRNLVIIPSQGSDAPMKYSGSGAPATLGGTPPDAGIAVVHKDRLLLTSGNWNTDSQRIYFSAAGNPESWDTTNRYLDTSGGIRGLASLRNALLVYHEGSVERIRGDIPPGSAAANMTLEPLFGDVGLLSALALTVADDYAYWCDADGIYRSDGSSITDLARVGGISNYWREVTPYALPAVGVFRNFLCVSVGSTSPVTGLLLVCDLRDHSWFRFTNLGTSGAVNFATRSGDADEMYFAGDFAGLKVRTMSGVFEPAAGNKNDADGDAVTPVVETGLYDGNSDALKRWKQVYLNYDLRDAASDNPTLTVSYLTDPAGTSYTALTPTLAETTRRERKRLPIGASLNQAMAFKIAQTNASSDTRISSIAAVVEAKEGSRLRAA